MSITVKHAILPAAVFIIVEIVLVAETISVLLLNEIGPRNPGAGPIAILLSVALLANLGLVCGVAAGIAADYARRSERAQARALIDSFTAPATGPELPAPSSPACGAFPAGPADSEDHGLAPAGAAMPASC